ncbi:hypothetical protein XENOCAPTIV_008400, partial [Xenoophorus captivus]
MLLFRSPVATRGRWVITGNCRGTRKRSQGYPTRGRSGGLTLRKGDESVCLSLQRQRRRLAQEEKPAGNSKSEDGPDEC